MNRTYDKIKFEHYLNENTNIDEDSEEWVIGGGYRKNYARRSLYGTALRNYDKKSFDQMYKDWLKSEGQ